MARRRRAAGTRPMLRVALPVALVALVASLAGLARGGGSSAISQLETLAPPASAGRFVYPAGRDQEIDLGGGETRHVRSLLQPAGPMRYGDYLWDEEGVPPGPVWVRVDLARQTLSVFRGGHEIGTAVILYGTDGHPTPRGRFAVLEMDRDHVSRTYDAPMPFMLRLTEDGVAIHASAVRRGFATHGCVGVPPDFAEKLFGQMRRGNLVVIA